MRELSPEKVIRSFFDAQGRLKSIPVKPGKRAIVLDRLAQAFEPERRYPEKEVNEVLLRFHEDYCTLRRFLVDSRLLHRAEGQYWRVNTAILTPSETTGV